MNKIRECIDALRAGKSVEEYGAYVVQIARGELARETFARSRAEALKAQLANKPSMRHPLVSVEPPPSLASLTAPTDKTK